MRIGNKKELKRIAEEKSGHLDYIKTFLKCIIIVQKIHILLWQ